MLDVLAWIVFGLIAGVIAKAILPGKDPGGAIITIVIGIVGSLIGGFIGRTLMGYGQINDSGDLSPGIFDESAACCGRRHRFARGLQIDQGP
jgi:uncharacterized membrane protein YeaQ/YmgE (transglycosylase-associated protein family)